MGEIAVEQHEGGADGQPGNEQVPHHPAGGGEPEEAVAGAEIQMQAELLRVLDEDATMPVHDRLRQPSRARGVEDVERCVERHRLERKCRRPRDDNVPWRHVVNSWVVTEIADQHCRPH